MLYKILLLATVPLLFSCGYQNRTGNNQEQAISETESYTYSSVPDISADDIHHYISVLASDSLEGRMAGTTGERKAGDYIVSRFTGMGLKNYQDSYYQPFSYQERKKIGNCSLSFGSFNGIYDRDFTSIVMLDSSNVSGRVMYAGYGDQYSRNGVVYYSDYENLNVKDKWVMIFEDDDFNNIVPDSRQNLLERYKIAEKHGAAGILVINPNRRSNGLLVPRNFSYYNTNYKIPLIRISGRTADSLFRYAKTTLPEVIEELNKSLDSKDNRKVHIEIPVNVKASIYSKQDSMYSNNIIGYAEGKDPVLKNEYIVIGAHYDHIGVETRYNINGNDTTLIYNGADDNASGVAGILEIAEKICLNNTHKRSIIFMAFGAEEQGLVGSKFLCDNLPVPPEKIRLMINLDMIGRMDSINNVYINTVIGNTPAESVIKNLSNSYPDIKLNFTPNQRSNSDHYYFYDKKIPVVFFTTGPHYEYHTPNDTISTINFNGAKHLLDMVYDFVLTEANAKKTDSK